MAKKSMNKAVKAMPKSRDPVNGFSPITPSQHQKSSSGIPEGYRNHRAPNAKPGNLPGMPKLPGC